MPNSDNKGNDFVANFNMEKNIKRIVDNKAIEVIKIKNKYSNESRVDYRNKLEKHGLNEKEIKEKLIERASKMAKNALKDLESLINKDILNKDSGIVLNGSKSDIKHLLKNERSEIKSTICSELEKLIETSIFLEKHPPKKDGDKYYLKDIYIFGNIVELNGKLYATRLTAKHYTADNRIGKYNLKVEEIKDSRGLGLSNSLVDKAHVSVPNAPSTSINITYLLKNVKDEKEKYFIEYL
jgi:hypothetical protein